MGQADIIQLSVLDHISDSAMQCQTKFKNLIKRIKNEIIMAFSIDLGFKLFDCVCR
jgi:hypothetical protein